MPPPEPVPEVRPSFWALQLAGWCAWAGIYAVASFGMMPPGRAFAFKAVQATLGLLATLPLRPLYRRLATRDRGGLATAFAVAAACFLVSLPWTACVNAAAVLMGLEEGPLAVSVSGSLGYASTLLAWSGLYFGIRHYYSVRDRDRALRERQAELEEQRRQAVLAQALARTAQLRALQAQLNPHFLFNALNSLATLIAEGDSAAANRLLSRLADFLRSTLEDRDHPEVSLERELMLTEQYLDVERARLQHRLRVEVDVDPATLRARVPTLLLQPLVENAIRHGIAPRQQGGRVTIESHRAVDKLRLVVRDAGLGASESSPERRGLGLANVGERLRCLFGDQHTLALRPAEADGMEVVVEVPYRLAEEAGAP